MSQSSFLLLLFDQNKIFFFHFQFDSQLYQRTNPFFSFEGAPEVENVQLKCTIAQVNLDYSRIFLLNRQQYKLNGIT